MGVLKGRGGAGRRALTWRCSASSPEPHPGARPRPRSGAQIGERSKPEGRLECSMQLPEVPSTQQLRFLDPNTIPLMAFGTRVLKYWVLGPPGTRSQRPYHHKRLLGLNSIILGMGPFGQVVRREDAAGCIKARMVGRALCRTPEGVHLWLFAVGLCH